MGGSGSKREEMGGGVGAGEGNRARTTGRESGEMEMRDGRNGVTQTATLGGNTWNSAYICTASLATL